MKISDILKIILGLCLLYLINACSNDERGSSQIVERTDTIITAVLDTVWIKDINPPNGLIPKFVTSRDTVFIRIKGRDTLSRVLKKGVGRPFDDYAKAEADLYRGNYNAENVGERVWADSAVLSQKYELIKKARK